MKAREDLSKEGAADDKITGGALQAEHDDSEMLEQHAKLSAVEKSKAASGEQNSAPQQKNQKQDPEAPSSAVEKPSQHVASSAAEPHKIRSESTAAAGEFDIVTAPNVPAAAPHSAADILHEFFLYLSIALTALIGVIGVTLYASKLVEASEVSQTIAGYCAVVCLIMTPFLIYLHLTAYTNPTQQRLIIRILLMVPIYAVDSFLALVAHRSATVVDLARDSYEAYVIYTFFNLLMNYLGSEEEVVKVWAAKKPKMQHVWPGNYCLPEFSLNNWTLQFWKLCLAQYVILNPLLAIVAIPLYFAQNYKDGDFSPSNAYIYLAAVKFVSVTFAFTCLVYFFFATKEFLTEHKPLAKFAAIKAVVFLTFWQAVLLGALNHFRIIPHSQLWTSEDVSTGLNNFLTCIEMLFMCFIHRWVFTDEAYLPVDGRRPLSWWAVVHMFSIRDVWEGTQEALQSPKDLWRSDKQPNTPLLADSQNVQRNLERDP